jgi:hypothetical protein
MGCNIIWMLTDWVWFKTFIIRVSENVKRWPDIPVMNLFWRKSWSKYMKGQLTLKRINYELLYILPLLILYDIISLKFDLKRLL